MDIRVEYEIDGHRVSEHEFASGIEGQILKIAADQITANLEQVHCPVHGTSPTNVTMERQGDELKFTASGCCDELQKAVNAAFSGQSSE